jgi:hypothetical protein
MATIEGFREVSSAFVELDITVISEKLQADDVADIVRVVDHVDQHECQ